MKLHYSALALAVYLGTAAAQGMDGLPACARDCATNSIPKECSLIDVGCICGNESFITSISCCVAKACEPSQQQAAIDFANQICRTGGITNLPQVASCTGGAQSTATETSGASSGTSSASKSTDTASGASATTTGASTVTGTATGTAASQTGTGSSTSSASPSATSGAAAVLHGKDTGVLAGVGAALFALLA